MTVLIKEELGAMSRIHRILSKLSPDAQQRVVKYFADQIQQKNEKPATV